MIDLSPIGTFLVTHFTIFFFFLGKSFCVHVEKLSFIVFFVPEICGYVHGVSDWAFYLVIK